MPRSAGSEPGGWLAPVLALTAAIVAARIGLLALARAEIFVDEAQYWLWGQELAFGYYSKPPMIGWVIRAVTELAGSDEAFWIRVPGPVLHGITAAILAGIAARASGARAALVVAAGYLTLPMVTVGSLLFSTDTVMAPFLAGALACWLLALERGAVRMGVFAGLLLGLAFLSKYAAVYYLIGAAAAAAAIPAARPRGAVALAGAGAFVLTISPNLIWNLQNGFTTVQHTLDNADWVRDPATRTELDPLNTVEFFVSQFGVFGPVPFAILLLALAGRIGRDAPWRGLLLWLSVPIVALVCGQALMGRAYANWAAAAYLAGSVLVFPVLLRHRGWLIGSFVFNGALALVLPIAATQADRLEIGGRQQFERYLGRAAVTDRIVTTARDAGLGTVVAMDRDLLADLFYRARASGLEFYALPPVGRAPHHYALRFPYPGDAGPVMLISGRAAPDCAPAARELDRIAPEDGAYRGEIFILYLIDGACLAP